MRALLTLHVGTKRLSSWSLRAYLALAHSGAPFETRTIVLDRSDTREKIAAVNPAGRVPVLYDGDLAVWDSLAICEYVSELVPDAQLWPADRAARARARSVSAEMHAGFEALRHNMPFELGAERPGQGHTPEALADIARIQSIWRELLGAHGGPYLFGRFSIADCMYAPVTVRFRTYGVALDDVCNRYVETVQANAGFRQWCADAQLEA